MGRMKSSTAAMAVAVVVLCIGAASAFYVPGTYPQEFNAGDVLNAHVNSLTSFEAELPFDYYSMPYCAPPEGIRRIENTANPGTILMGLRIENSPYNFTTKVKQSSELVCKPTGSAEALTSKHVENIKNKIDNHYRVNMMLDNLPVTVYDLLDEDQEYVRPGFEIGYKENGKYYIYNHLVFNILVHTTHGEYKVYGRDFNDAAAELEIRRHHRRHLTQEATEVAVGADASSSEPIVQVEEAVTTTTGVPDVLYMVVGFEVSPCSIYREKGVAVEEVVCGVDGDAHIKAQEVVEGAEIVYTYDVYWQDSKIQWTSRWDAYLKMPGGKVHWFSIMNASIVVLIMATVVAMILVRTVRRDLNRYEAIREGSGLDMKDEAGWKLVAGDVFRPPPTSAWLAVHIGSGIQIMATGSVTLILATLGFLSPASRGALLTTTIVLYVCLAFVSGWVSVWAWGLMERAYAGWFRIALRTSLYYPGIMMGIFTLLNLVIHHTGSLGAVPIGMYFSIVATWFLISIPLTFIGGYLATYVTILDYPTKTNQIPRHIPPSSLLANPLLLFVLSGILPFGTVFIELYFALTSVWLGYFYYLFGFVLLIGVLALVITVEVSILCTYVQLCAEDYQWWWRSFNRGGSFVIYVALYALAFMISNSDSLAGPMPIFIYICYTSILLLGVYLAMGTVGVLSSLVFVHAIFSAVKQD